MIDYITEQQFSFSSNFLSSENQIPDNSDRERFNRDVLPKKYLFFYIAHELIFKTKDSHQGEGKQNQIMEVEVNQESGSEIQH